MGFIGLLQGFRVAGFWGTGMQVSFLGFLRQDAMQRARIPRSGRILDSEFKSPQPGI